MDHQAVVESVNPILQEEKTLPWPNLGRLVTQPLPTVPQILFYFFSNLMS